MLEDLDFWIVLMFFFLLGVGFRRWAYNISPKGPLGTYSLGLRGSLFARTWEFPFTSFFLSHALMRLCVGLSYANEWLFSHISFHSFLHQLMRRRTITVIEDQL